MQFLANENFPLDAVAAVRKIGHDVAWIRTDAPGSKDRDILKRAVSEQRILLTFDKDFGELAFAVGLPASCGIVLLRVQAAHPQRWQGSRDSAANPNRLGRAVLGGRARPHSD